jgi:hypothetical protein
MPNPFSKNVESFQKQQEQRRHKQEQQWRQQQRRKEKQERSRRQEEVFKSAAGEKAARQRAQALQDLRRDAAGRRKAFADTLHWNTMQSRAYALGGGAGQPKLRRFASRFVYGVAAVSVLVNIVLFMRWSPSRALLTVGKHTVSKQDYEANLDAAAGKAVLSRMVVAELIRQAAAQAKVTPTAADIDARIALLRRQGAIPPQPAADLRDSIGQRLALENLRMQGIRVSDADVAAEYAKHPDKFRLPAQMSATLVVAAGADKTAQATYLLGTGVAPSAVAAVPGLQVDGINGFALPAGALSLGLRQAILRLHDGEVKVFSSRGSRPGAGAFLVVRANSHVAGILPPLPQVRDLVARETRLENAPSAPTELLTLYAANKPVFDMTNYQPYIGDLEAAASHLPPATAAQPTAKTASLPSP